jgi:hypothetical protein
MTAKSKREFKQKIAREITQKIRRQRREEFLRLMEKGKMETYEDIIAIFNGLSRKAKDSAVLCRIYQLAKLGKSPIEIIKTMEPEKV